jgi:DNA-binding transcriptional ArsR family regulator
MRKSAPTAIEDVAQLRALASAVRLDIVDTLQAMGEASAPDLAQQLGRPADALYYHIRALSAAGLVAEVGVRRKGRNTESVYAIASPTRTLSLSHRPKGRQGREGLNRIVRAMLQTSGREYRAALAAGACIAYGPTRELWPSRSLGWLSKAKLARANQLLTELNRLMLAKRSSDDDRLYTLQFMFAPAVTARKAGGDVNRAPRTRGKKS